MGSLLPMARVRRWLTIAGNDRRSAPARDIFVSTMTTPPGRKSVVIADVARAAGVSVPTVSRVLTGAARVSPDKLARVQRAIEELNFSPSSAARALVHGHAQMIAIVASDTTKYGYATTIRGVEIAARAAGYVVLIVVIEGDSDEAVQPALDLLLNQPLAGIVVLQFDTLGVRAARALPKTMPVAVVSGQRSRGRSHATIDEIAGGEEVVEYLLRLGHRTVHYVSIPAMGEENGRTVGWRNALMRQGIEPPAILSGSWDARSGIDIGHRLAEDPAVTAVFCGNDEIAMGVMRGIQNRGRSIPGDISVVGFDDHPLSELWLPALTTSRQDFVELGRRAFELLLAQVEGRPPRTSSLLPRLVTRESAAMRSGNQHLGPRAGAADELR